VTVVLELEWVLRASFGFANDDVMSTLSSLFSAVELSFQEERALEGCAAAASRGFGATRSTEFRPDFCGR
jgi:hypothetical protein